jgi:hypothetical protein
MPGSQGGPGKRDPCGTVNPLHAVPKGLDAVTLLLKVRAPRLYPDHKLLSKEAGSAGLVAPLSPWDERIQSNIPQPHWDERIRSNVPQPTSQSAEGGAGNARSNSEQSVASPILGPGPLSPWRRVWRV